MRKHALTPDVARAGALIPHATSKVRGNCVAAIAKLFLRGGSNVRRDRFGFIAEQSSGDDVAGLVVARAPAARGLPVFARPMRRIAPVWSMPARWSMTQAAPKFSHAISSWRDSWTRTGLSHRLRQQARRRGKLCRRRSDRNIRSRARRSHARCRAATPRIFATMLRVGYTDCVADQIVARSLFTSATAHDVPTEPCIW